MSIQDPLWQRPLTEALTEAHDIVEWAKTEHRPDATFILTSGGNDSAVLLDTMIEHADAVVHINTGVGIPDANAHARRVGESYGKPFLELHPPVAYEELVLTHPTLNGLPGPGVHHIIYQRLKERCVEALVRTHKTSRKGRIMLLTGVRKAESKRRMGYRSPLDRKGAQVWVNPLLRWSNDEMLRYRAERRLPQSEVAANLHMSGECLCGAMADQGPERGERAAIWFFYPEFDARLCALEEECRRAGKRYCEWGVKRDEVLTVDPAQLSFEPLCAGCEFRSEPA